MPEAAKPAGAFSGAATPTVALLKFKFSAAFAAASAIVPLKPESAPEPRAARAAFGTPIPAKFKKTEPTLVPEIVVVEPVCPKAAALLN